MIESDRFKQFVAWWLAISFFGGIAAVMGMGVTYIWEQDVTYRMFASLGAVCGVGFLPSLLLMLMLLMYEGSKKRSLSPTRGEG